MNSSSVEGRYHGGSGPQPRRNSFVVSLIWTIVVVLFVLWLVFFALKIGGALIWLLLVLAGAGLVFNLLVGRRTILCGNCPAMGETTGGGLRRGLGRALPGGRARLWPDFCGGTP